ncbi:MAG: DUF2917 domain-containing protein [Chloroflexota bacterium]
MELTSIFRLARTQTQRWFVKSTQFVLQKGDARSIPLQSTSRVLYILSGCVWITYKGEDTILRAGEEMLLTPANDHIVISAEGRASASFELRP